MTLEEKCQKQKFKDKLKYKLSCLLVKMVACFSSYVLRFYYRERRTRHVLLISNDVNHKVNLFKRETASFFTNNYLPYDEDTCDLRQTYKRATET